MTLYSMQSDTDTIPDDIHFKLGNSGWGQTTTGSCFGAVSLRMR
jgi:hypothetical protein